MAYISKAWRRPSFISTKTGLLLLVALLELLVALFASITLYQSRGEYEARARVSSDNLAELLSHDLASSFDKIDLMLLAIKDELERRLTAGGTVTADFSAFIVRQKSRQADVATVAYLDKYGHVRYATGLTAGVKATYEDRAYFVHLKKEPKSELVISKPLLAKISGKWQVVFARRISKPDGAFAGVVLAAVQLERFQAQFSKLKLGPKSAVNLRDGDLATVTRYPDTVPTSTGNPTVSKEWKEKLKENPAFGSYFAVGLDNLGRAISYRKIGRYPHYIIVGLYPPDYLEAWSDEVQNTLVLATVAAILIVLLGIGSWKLVNAWTEIKSSEESVRRLNAELEQKVTERTRDWREKVSELGVEIIERQKAEATSKESEARLTFALQASHTGGWDLDLMDHTAHRTIEHDRIFGYDALLPEWTYEMFLEHVLPEDRAEVDRRFKEATASQVNWNFECRIRRADGAVRWIRAAGGHMLDGTGRARRMAGIVQDITELKQVEAQRDLMEARARESQKMEALGTLAGGVAHDFNNALATILGNLELARQDVGPAHPALESLGEIDKASRRAKDLVQQILAFGRRQHTQLKQISLAPVVKEAGRLLRATIPAGIQVNVECAAAVPEVFADATQIEQVLLNLGTNAWHAIQGQERSGVIGIRLQSDIQNGLPIVILSVTDNGRGIDAEVRHQIFEPFFTTKGMGEGTGLGLAVVHGIVEEHGGSIEVDSTPGEGTTFVVRFPAAQPASGPGTAPAIDLMDAGAHQEPLPRGKGQHILYIDDDEAIVSLTKRLLERQGYRVSGYTDAQEALSILRARPDQFDLAVTDYNMPGMSGLDVARALHEIRTDLPVVLASGYITEDLRTKALASGVRELIYKPNTVDDLCEAVARYAKAQS